MFGNKPKGPSLERMNLATGRGERSGLESRFNVSPEDMAQLMGLAQGIIQSQGNTGNQDSVLRRNLSEKIGEAKVDEIVNWLIENKDQIGTT